MSEFPTTILAGVVDASPERGGGLTGTLLRAGVSVTALAIVASRIDLRAVRDGLTALDWPWMLGAASTVCSAILLSAVKWRVLLRSRERALPLTRLIRHYLVGLFFNNFLPTSVGGDVVRAWDVGRDLDDTSEGAASVVAERLIASVGLALTAAIGLPFVRVGAPVYVAVAVVFVVGAGLAGLFLVPSLSERMVSSAMGRRFEGVAGWLGATTRITGEVLRDKRTVLLVLALSVLFQVLVAAVTWFIFRALGAEVSLVECVVYTSIVSAVTMVPVSISGHGVREAGYAYFFALAGVAPATAVTASMLFFATVAVCTLPGAAFFAAGRRHAS
ncbi:MAG: lysylphosphatidylglycerol synthase transmembrane domain-containing protein [Coriobacteriia bacterium]|nr:lysylphosphatidylglycerol synthase transmembrane domain-containing protein [Coriobacteriia bacterium]